MKLSVLITFYNQEKYVDKTLESVLSQKTNFDFEVLVGDDGSSDNTVEKVKFWQSRYPNIKIFIMDRKKYEKYNSISRASKNRINLIKQASGEYITFLDGDDFYIDNSKFGIQIDILDNPDNKDCVACSHDVDFFYEETGEQKPFISRIWNGNKITAKQYWSKLYFPAFSFIFRNIFNQNFPATFNQNFFDDNLITFYFLKFGSIFYIPKIMSCYTQTKDSIWGEKSKIEQEILNLMDYDMELQIAPEFANLSLMRHFGNYKFLYKNRKKISEDLIDKYCVLAKASGCESLIGLFHYKNSLTDLHRAIKYYYLSIKYKINQSK